MGERGMPSVWWCESCGEKRTGFDRNGEVVCGSGHIIAVFEEESRPAPRPVEVTEDAIEALERKKYAPPLAYDESIWNAAVNECIATLRAQPAGGTPWEGSCPDCIFTPLGGGMSWRPCAKHEGVTYTAPVADTSHHPDCARLSALHGMAGCVCKPSVADAGGTP